MPTGLVEDPVKVDGVGRIDSLERGPGLIWDGDVLAEVSRLYLDPARRAVMHRCDVKHGLDRRTRGDPRAREPQAGDSVSLTVLAGERERAGAPEVAWISRLGPRARGGFAIEELEQERFDSTRDVRPGQRV